MVSMGKGRGDMLGGLEPVRDIPIGDMPAACLIGQMRTAGFQASGLGTAVGLIEQMKKEHCTVFFAFTANLVASGLRGVIAEMCRKKFIDAVVTTSGSIEHDVIKSFAPYYLGDFLADDALLRRNGINRLGNIFIPTKHYALFEKHVQGWLGKMHAEHGTVSPSMLCEEIGRRIGDVKMKGVKDRGVGGTNAEGSFLHHCAANSIPVFCPGITDGALGLQMYFFKQSNPEFAVDVTGDMKRLADLVLGAEKTAAIVLGGGIAKHHVIGANILRDGLDYAVYVTTAQEFDGSLSGALPREAKSWGKVKAEAKTVTVHADASIAFPLIASALRENGVL